VAITDIVQQKKEAALNNLASSTSKTASPKVKLDPLYDTPPVGDGVTSFERVNLLIANPAELTWWDKNGNGQLDPDEPVATGGVIRDIPLALGNNTIAIVQKSAGKSVSDPTILYLYRESSLFQNTPANQYATTLQQLAIAYWGRPLTPEERQVGIDYLIKSGGNTQGVIDYLRSTPEFISYYTSPNFLDAITKAYQTLYHRGPTASEIAAALAQPDPTLLPALLLQSENPLDQQLLAAKVLAAEQITQNYNTLLEGAQGNTLLLNEAVRAQLSQMSVTTPPGQIVAAIKNSPTDVVTPGKTAAYAGTTITLEFDRPIDWRRLDTNQDGKLDIRNLNQNGDTGELQIAWGGSGNNPPQLNNAQLAAAVIDPIPAYGSRFLTITGVAITAKDSTQPLDGDLTLILVGVPDVQYGITSNVVFTI